MWGFFLWQPFKQRYVCLLDGVEVQKGVSTAACVLGLRGKVMQVWECVVL